MGGAPSRLVLAARVVVVLAAAMALPLALRLARGRDGPVAGAWRYACPMHPEVTATAAGACPLCRMALVAARPSPARAVPDEAVATPRTMTMARELSAPAWVDGPGHVTALLYADELTLLSAGATAQLVLGRGHARVTVRLGDAPPVRWDDATWCTRWRVVDGGGGAGGGGDAGSVGWLELPRRPRAIMALPAAAVLWSPTGPYALVVVGGTVAARPIVTGRAFVDFVPVVAGLAAGERVIVRDAALFDAERRLAVATELPP